MSRCVVDTNVPIVANGRSDDDDALPSIECRESAVRFLQEVLQNGTVLLDAAGAIQQEYRNKLNSSGQPGVGDRFYQQVIHCAVSITERIDLPIRQDGEYADLPQSLIDVGFDPSDRKFAALANKEHVPVVNATDSDWIEHAETLRLENISVRNLCGCDQERWFAK